MFAATAACMTSRSPEHRRQNTEDSGSSSTRSVRDRRHEFPQCRFRSLLLYLPSSYLASEISTKQIEGETEALLRHFGIVAFRPRRA